MKKDIDGVVCLWRYTGDGYPQWECVEAFAISENCDILSPTKHASRRDPEPWRKWMFKGDKEIMGRAVTLWTLTGGVRLVEFHPPEWAKWLSVSFTEKLQKSPDWVTMLQDGHVLYLNTIIEVQKLLQISIRREKNETRT